MRAWTLPLTPFGPGLIPPVIDDARQIADGERTRLDDILRPVRARARDVAIESVVRTGSAASELIELAAGAALVVVSAHRGHGTFPMRIGPTTHAVLHHAPCPVAVVPVPHASRGEAAPSRRRRPRERAADQSATSSMAPAGELTAGTVRAAGKVVPERVTIPGDNGVGTRELVEMTDEESYAHVALRQVGRVSMINASVPFILPVNYRLVGADIEFSTSADSTLARTCGPVLFEVDEVIDMASIGWSVFFFGIAERLRPCEETGASVAWPLDHGDIRIRIGPERITGRRVRPVMAPRR
ncbi:pyridoxamine 5'-phosphate oxidase family protein [Embleya sp. NPDC055664]